MKHFLWEVYGNPKKRSILHGVVVAMDVEAVKRYVVGQIRGHWDWEGGAVLQVTPLEEPSEFGEVWPFTTQPGGVSQFLIDELPWVYEIGDIGRLVYEVEATRNDCSTWFVPQGTLVEIADQEIVEDQDQGLYVKRYTAWVLNRKGARRRDGSSMSGLFDGSIVVERHR